jgi:hypothetical protein
MDDIQELLDEIEDELHQELEVTEDSRDKAQQAVERSLTISTPVRRFYERYRDGNDKNYKRSLTIGASGFFESVVLVVLEAQLGGSLNSFPMELV